MTIEIAAATDADLDAIHAIAVLSFPKPWPLQAFQAELRATWARLDVARANGVIDPTPHSLVGSAAHPGTAEVIGFCNYWVVPPELHLHVIAVQPDQRGHGVGSALVRHVLDSAARERCSHAMLEVRASNAAAVRLYQHAGFATVHVRPRYYSDNDEDALVMSCVVR